MTSLGKNNQVTFCTNLSLILPGSTATRTKLGSIFLLDAMSGDEEHGLTKSAPFKGEIPAQPTSMQWDGGTSNFSYSAAESISAWCFRKTVGGGRRVRCRLYRGISWWSWGRLYQGTWPAEITKPQVRIIIYLTCLKSQMMDYLIPQTKRPLNSSHI